MKPPKTVRVGPYTYAVSTDRDDLNAVIVEEGGRPLMGHIDHGKQTILLDPALGPDALAETLWHEVIHAVAEHTGLDAELGDDDTEKLIRRLAPMFVDVLRRNPKLVRFLTEQRS